MEAADDGCERSSARPLDSMPAQFRSALDEFRNDWQQELRGQGSGELLTANESAGLAVSPLNPAESELAIAEGLFRRAVELEQRGKVYDALPLYRKAVQMVPDIELRFYEQQKSKLAAEAAAASATAAANKSVPYSQRATGGESDNEEQLIDDLYEKFRVDLLQDYGGKLLLSSRDAGVLTTERHISDLPPELLLCILRWVVSADLDLRSLEQCAAASKGMYLCARDDDIWRLACMKVWSYNMEAPVVPATPLGYSSWRQMFLNRERLLFNGCYISKTTYLRMGENSFQDQFYRPVQLVEYFRYLRFLPDGQALMMTTADEPALGVGRLRNLQQLRSDVLRGHYRLFGNTVSIVVKKQSAAQQPRLIGKRRGSAAFIDENDISYCIEFRIMSTLKRKFVQLAWLHYSIEQRRNKLLTSTEFDLMPSKYPPLWFSPVRSYHQQSDAPLA